MLDFSLRVLACHFSIGLHSKKSQVFRTIFFLYPLFTKQCDKDATISNQEILLILSQRFATRCLHGKRLHINCCHAIMYSYAYIRISASCHSMYSRTFWPHLNSHMFKVTLMFCEMVHVSLRLRRRSYIHMYECTAEYFITLSCKCIFKKLFVLRFKI